MKSSLQKPKGLLQLGRLFGTGFTMGAADIVPGVSGGTMAFIMGVYEDLVFAIKSFGISSLRLFFGGKWKELWGAHPWVFLLSLGAGILTAIVTLASLLKGLLENQPTYLFSFFGGLIVASILTIAFRFRWHWPTVAALLVGTIGAFFLVGLNPQESVSHDPLTLFLSGMVAITAMILPGISGSFILLLLGQYEFVIGAVHDRDILSLAVVAFGCLVGILLFVRLLSFLLSRYHDLTIALLTGFMCGSLRVIWEKAASGTALMGAFGQKELLCTTVCFGVGFILVLALDRVQKKLAS